MLDQVNVDRAFLYTFKEDIQNFIKGMLYAIDYSLNARVPVDTAHFHLQVDKLVERSEKLLQNFPPYYKNDIIQLRAMLDEAIRHLHSITERNKSSFEYCNFVSKNSKREDRILPVELTDTVFGKKCDSQSQIEIDDNSDCFRCKVPTCDFVCYRKSSLYAHERTHDDAERPFVCPVKICQQRFAKKAYLVVHLRTHTGKRSRVRLRGVKPYKCDSCGKRFTQKSTLNTHRKNIHG
ncbi:hypothetical protein ROZALSC1DRAFT_29215 [Rozella allomycis CSF55]|uniref:C2H2-type domain-containing protein n=1 Tax=Rozella allomycis (strain CSF55) TaxID=988480 RepID=A0A4P9YIE5_ROZAC|nr:hypothetical protein ROZALSC1DRAFT_29215 [Rozella allomycis CSF55]